MTANVSEVVPFDRIMPSSYDSFDSLESYITLLTSKNCTNIKVWKSVEKNGEFDVYFHIQAKGRSVSEFDLKTYVAFPEKDKCQFKIEDWADGTRGHIDGRVVKNNGLFKCELAPTQTNPPVPRYDYFGDYPVEV